MSRLDSLFYIAWMIIILSFLLKFQVGTLNFVIGVAAFAFWTAEFILSMETYE